MSTYFVTRHAGAREWAERRGLEAVAVQHLDPGTVRPGDIVLGTLPIQLVAEVNLRGGRYLHLELDLPDNARGKDLSADEMEAFGARLVEYEARNVEGAPRHD
jgi:CRISPR-associated protein Csx16